MARAARHPSFAPLLVWTGLQELERLHARREALSQRVKVLPPNSHRRVELEARLRALTNDLLAAERRVAEEASN